MRALLQWLRRLLQRAEQLIRVGLTAAKHQELSGIVFWAALIGVCGAFTGVAFRASVRLVQRVLTGQYAGLVETAIWFYAMRAGLVDGMDQRSQKIFLQRSGRIPVIFAISIVIAQFDARAAIYFWLAIAVSGWGINYYYERHPMEASSASPAGPDVGSG